MRLLTTTLLLAMAHSAAAQPPRPPGGGSERGAAPTAEGFLARLMPLDSNQDGRLTLEEVTDVRLHPLLTRADANKDGSVTSDELKELYARESTALGRGRGTGQPGGGPGGPGGGPMGPGGPGRMPRPGEVLPPHLQDELRLTNDQREQLATLQKEVDTRLEKILTAEQRTELSRLRERGPGGPGRPGGRGASGRPMPGGEGDREGRQPPAE